MPPNSLGGGDPVRRLEFLLRTIGLTGDHNPEKIDNGEKWRVLRK
jgi:hypothetical protein